MTGLREILEFYAEAGLDWPIGETPVDHFRQACRRRPRRWPLERGQPARRACRSQPPTDAAARAPPARPARAAVPDSRARGRGARLAGSARTLDELKAALGYFDGCNLKTMAKNLVFADGNPEADLMFVGGAPGSDDDVEGLPFMGPPGHLLDRMLGAMGLDRKSVYLANVVPWRPPGNRQPTPMEIEICRPSSSGRSSSPTPRCWWRWATCRAPSSRTRPATSCACAVLARTGRRARASPSPPCRRCIRTICGSTPRTRNSVWRDMLAVKAKLRGD